MKYLRLILLIESLLVFIPFFLWITPDGGAFTWVRFIVFVPLFLFFTVMCAWIDKCNDWN